MPTYRNDRAVPIEIETRNNNHAGMVQSRRIAPGETFTALSTDIPVRWLAQGNKLEGSTPWVSLVDDEPTDEELSS